MDKPSVLLIDNFDSFSFNLVDEFARRGHEVVVQRNTIGAAGALRLLDQMDRPLLVVSPGPGRPADAGCSVELVRAATVPVLGICLGHQAIVEAFGGAVDHAPRVLHGKATPIRHDGAGLFAELPSPLRVGRYHSLAATTLPEELAAVAHDRDGTVMAVRHVSRPIHGLQFHPESILTTEGSRLIDAFVAHAAEVSHA
jgi:anthranilate synthase/aminodeoxychorismate synthase-like glutamine amidotransferase